MSDVLDEKYFEPIYAPLRLSFVEETRGHRNAVYFRDAFFFRGVKSECVANKRCNSSACVPCSFAAYRAFVDKMDATWKHSGHLVEVGIETDFAPDFCRIKKTTDSVTRAVKLLSETIGIRHKLVGTYHLKSFHNTWSLALNLVVELIGSTDNQVSSLCEDLEEDGICWYANGVEGKGALREALVRAAFPAAIRHLHQHPYVRADYPETDDDAFILKLWLQLPHPPGLTFRKNI